VIDRKIELHCDVANMLTVVLPHETTHAVLSGRFGRHLVPRWADEGMALLSEPRERVDLYLKTLPKHRSNHELFALSKLMSMENYPEPRLVRPFYAQSIGLVEFLSSQKGGPQEFARFVRDGLDNGYEAALRAEEPLGSARRGRVQKPVTVLVSSTCQRVPGQQTGQEEFFLDGRFETQERVEGRLRLVNKRQHIRAAKAFRPVVVGQMSPFLEIDKLARHVPDVDRD
jgi:hypothetical protein